MVLGLASVWPLASLRLFGASLRRENIGSFYLAARWGRSSLRAGETIANFLGGAGGRLVDIAAAQATRASKQTHTGRLPAAGRKLFKLLVGRIRTFF